MKYLMHVCKISKLSYNNDTFKPIVQFYLFLLDGIPIFQKSTIARKKIELKQEICLTFLDFFVFKSKAF
jgi:hypothetical protein